MHFDPRVVSEMTYYVSTGMLNPTHSITHFDLGSYFLDTSVTLRLADLSLTLTCILTLYLNSCMTLLFSLIERWGPVKIWKIRWMSAVNFTHRKRTFWPQHLNVRCTSSLKFVLKIYGDGRQWNRQWFQVEPETEEMILVLDLSDLSSILVFFLLTLCV